jgi:GT2 family glycosyltransferase
MLIRRNAWIEVGGFSERWFMYGEDVDFCFRLKQHGYEVLMNQDIVVSHEIGQSSTGIDGKISGVWLSNLYDFYASTIASNFIERFAWKAIMWAGFAIRANSFSLLSRVREDRDDALEARRFRIYARIIRPSYSDLLARPPKSASS